MADRVNKKEINNLFALFCRVNGFPLAKSYKDVGGYALDYYGIGGGYMIVRIANERGGHSTPFGHLRRKAGAFADVLRFGIDVANNFTCPSCGYSHNSGQVEDRRPGKPYSQYAGNPSGALHEAQQEARALGYTLSKSHDGEYSVKPVGARGDVGTYFTNDLADAIGTARIMARELKSNPSRRGGDKSAEALRRLRELNFGEERYKGYRIRVNALSNTMWIEKDGALIAHVPANQSWDWARREIDKLV